MVFCKWVGVGLLTMTFVLSGCTRPLIAELRYPGGYTGYVMDKHSFDTSDSKRVALLRYAIVLAIAAKVGEEGVSTQDADSFAKQLSEAADAINYAAANLGFDETGKLKTCSVAGNDRDCSGYYVNFESETAGIETRVIRAMLTSLPSTQAREFLNNLASGNIFSATTALFRSVQPLVTAFHRGSGSWRSGLETVAAGMETCSTDPSYAKGGHRSLRNESGKTPFNEETMGIYQAAECLGLSQDSLFDSDSASPTEVGSGDVKATAFDAIFRIARAACVSLPIDSNLTPARIDLTKTLRHNACGRIRFEPKSRPAEIELDMPAQVGAAVVPPIAPQPAPVATPGTDESPLVLPPPPA